MNLSLVLKMKAFLCGQPLIILIPSFLAICLHGSGIINVAGKLNVHLVPRLTSDSSGWSRTVGQYYSTGSNSSCIQDACLENVGVSIVNSLLRDPNRKYAYWEVRFFSRWWETQSTEIQEQVKGLVASGQIEFINGGWCMHDEGPTHYVDMIDQTTLGHHWLKSNFNVTPRAGWQYYQYGHSAVQAYLLGAEAGFDSVHFYSADYQDNAQRRANKTLEVVWRGSRTCGSSAQIFANAIPGNYFVPIQVNYTIEQQINDFINSAINQASITRTNHILWTLSTDYDYPNAESWFKEMDELIQYVNLDGRVTVSYSTLSTYTDAKNAVNNQSWPVKKDDYLPYASTPNSYWTGYFTSRPSLKRYIRFLSGYYQAARQLEFLIGRNSTGPNTYSLGDALGKGQCLAVTGMSRQNKTDDYAKQLAIGASEAETVVNSALSYLVTSDSSSKFGASSIFSQCGLLNISYCPPTEQDIDPGQSLVVVAYNPLGWERTDFIRIPVNDSNIVVKDSSGIEVETQYVELDEVTINLRNFYVEAYTGVKPEMAAPKYWLIFQASVPPLGYNTYFISKSSQSENKEVSSKDLPQNGTVVIGQGNLKLTFSSVSGQLTHMSNDVIGVSIPIQQGYLWYASSTGDSVDDQPSTAAIFRPDGSPPTVVSNSVSFEVIRGPLFEEIQQKFSSWIYQVIRVYKDKDHAEVEFTIGPIPTDDGIGKEVITQITTGMTTEKVFYTDSNGRDFMKRVRDYRSDWPLQVTQPVAGNYYPLNLGIYTSGDGSELSVLVDRAAGGSSIKDGQIEVMFHRRMLNSTENTWREALDEKVCVDNNTTCHGLTIRGTYYISANKKGEGSRWRRTTGQEIYSPLVLAFTHENSENWRSSHKSTATFMEVNYTLPPNVALITLQELSDGNVLLRLGHLYEANEDAEYSFLAEIDLHKFFAGKTIKTLQETSLTANQDKSKMKKMDWNVEEDDDEYDTTESSTPVRGEPVDFSNPVVRLGPMEIRTFLLTF